MGAKASGRARTCQEGYEKRINHLTAVQQQHDIDLFVERFARPCAICTAFSLKLSEVKHCDRVFATYWCLLAVFRRRQLPSLTSSAERLDRRGLKFPELRIPSSSSSRLPSRLRLWLPRRLPSRLRRSYLVAASAVTFETASGVS